MKKTSMKSTGKLKYIASTLTTIIAAGVSLILAYSIKFSVSNLSIYLIPIVLFLFIIIGFEIWRRKKLKDTIKETNILSFLNDLCDKLKRDINKDLYANVMVKVGKNYLKTLSSTTAEADIHSQYIDINTSVSGTSSINKVPLFINIDDSANYEKYRKFIKDPRQSIRSEIAIPIIDDSGKVLGVINFESTEKLTNEDSQKIIDEITNSMEILKKAAKSAYTYSE